MPNAIAAHTFHRLLVLSAFAWLFFATSMPASAADIFRLWHGMGIQGVDQTWTLEIDLKSKKPKVKYPSLKCSGNWQRISSSKGVYLYREVISEGRQNCIDGYARVFLLKNKRLAIEYSEVRGGPVNSRAVAFPGASHAENTDEILNIVREFNAGRTLK
jgi:hypothetical protein